jgi:hypothetical protein
MAAGWVVAARQERAAPQLMIATTQEMIGLATTALSSRISLYAFPTAVIQQQEPILQIKGD